MALDQNKASEFIRDMERNFQGLAGIVPQRLHRRFRLEAMSTALAEAVKLVEGSRPPVFYVSGGTAKSRGALLHALTRRPISLRAPKSGSGAVRYTVAFPEKNATWDFIVAQEADPGAHRPDIWLHLLPAAEAGNLAEAESLCRQAAALEQSGGRRIPLVFVLADAHQLVHATAWPPEDHAQTAGALQNALQGFEPLAAQRRVVDLNFPYRGLAFGEGHESAVIPLGGADGWNADVLLRVLGERLPENALIHYYQAIGREEELRVLAQSVTRRFAAMAGGIGATPLPMADVLVLLPLQMLLIAIVGGLAGRPMSRETVLEYMSAAGLGAGAGLVFRQVARQTLKFVPIAGHLVSGAIAGGATYGIGRAAEAYFFKGEIKNPKVFEKEFPKLG